MTDPAQAAVPRPETSLTDEGILEHLRTRIAPDLELRPDEVAGLTLSTRVAEGLQLDSLRQVILLARIEEDYGVSFGAEDIEVLQEVVTVSDLVRLVRERARAVPS